MGTMIEIDGIDVYRAEPSGPLRGGLIVIEEIWGLVPHIKAVADRFAGEGYLVLAPELLGDLLGTENGQQLMEARNDPDEARRTAVQPALRQLFSGMSDPAFAGGAVEHLRALVDVLEAEPGVDGRIGVTGFCFGGTYSFAIAATDPRVKAAVPFYGSAPSAEDIAGIACPVLALYGQEDTRLIEVLPEVTAAFAAAGKDLTTHVYPDTGHAFFNDTNPHSYNAADAADAWTRATAFLAEHDTA
jgi:carboxymethylenebutenolidase